jgi:hypothetical protein
VYADSEALVLESGEESIDSIAAAFADLSVREAGVDESFGDALFDGEELFALEAPEASKPFLEALWHALCVFAVASNRPHVFAWAS